MKSKTEAVLVSANDYEQAKRGAMLAASEGVCRVVFTDRVVPVCRYLYTN